MLKSAPSGCRMLPSNASFELKGYGSEAALNLAAFLSHRSEMATASSFASLRPAFAAAFCLWVSQVSVSMKQG